MSDSWRYLFRRLAAGCLVAGASAWSCAATYAQVAFDSADDAAYAAPGGWQAGDDGGFGSFGPWSFTGTYASAVQQRMDDGLKTGAAGSSTFNNLGRAWSLFNPAAGDFARAGRSIGNLQVGQTVSVVIDNPTARQTFRGYSVKLNTGGGNACTTGCSPAAVVKYKVERLENFDNGQWTDTSGHFGLFDTDTDSGTRIEFVLSSPTTYEMNITPLDNTGAAVATFGTLANPATTTPINWIEFQFFNTQTNASADTDFFIKSMQILAAPPALPGDYDGSHAVGGGDLNLVLNNWNATVPPVPAGWIGDQPDPGVIGGQALNKLLNNWGNTGGSGASFGAVPEPATFAYAAACIASVIGAGARRLGRFPAVVTRSRSLSRVDVLDEVSPAVDRFIVDPADMTSL